MKKFLKVFGITLLSLVSILYLVFLFVLPNVVNLNQFKPMVQQIVKEQVHLNIDFNNLKISTTPSLKAGIILSDLKVKLPDNSTLISTEQIKARISLPSLFLLTVKLSDAEIVSPRVYLDIENGRQYKIVKLIQIHLYNRERRLHRLCRRIAHKPLCRSCTRRLSFRRA